MFILVVNLVNLGQDASQFIFKKYDCGDNYSTTLLLIYLKVHKLQPSHVDKLSNS